MNEQLSRDKDRKCNQEPDVHFNVVKKGKLAQASCGGAEGREEQQWQPCDQSDNEQPTMYKF
jgi:hypothetical protein